MEEALSLHPPEAMHPVISNSGLLLEEGQQMPLATDSRKRYKARCKRRSPNHLSLGQGRKRACAKDPVLIQSRSQIPQGRAENRKLSFTKLVKKKECPLLFNIVLGVPFSATRDATEIQDMDVGMKK